MAAVSTARRSFLGWLGKAPAAVAIAAAPASAAEKEKAGWSRVNVESMLRKEQAAIVARPGSRPAAGRIVPVPACEHACKPCFLECARRDGMAEFWRKELACFDASILSKEP